MSKQQKRDRRAFTLKRRAAFYTDMQGNLKDGIAPYQAIERMAEVAKRRRKNRAMARLYERILRDMEGDQATDESMSFAESLATKVPGNEAVMLLGADRAGPKTLMDALGELAGLLDRQAEANRTLVRALRTSGMNIAATVGVMYWIMGWIVPDLAKNGTPEMVPYMNVASAYFAFGAGFTSAFPFGVGALVGLGFWIHWSLANWTRNRRYWSRQWFDDHVMPWSLHQRKQATFFLSGTAAMLRAGVPLQTSAADSLPYAFPWLRKHLAKILADLEAGVPEVSSLAGGMLPIEARERLEVYSLQKDFTSVMSRLADDTFKEYEATIEAFGERLSTWSLVTLAVFAAATMAAMFNFSNALKSSVDAISHLAGH